MLIKIWDFENGEFERSLKGHTDTVQDIDFNSSGKMLGISISHFFKFLFVTQFPVPLTWLSRFGILSILMNVWKHLRGLIFIYFPSRNVFFFLFYRHEHNVSSVVFLPSSDFVLSASRDKLIKLWDIANGYCVQTFSKHTDWVRKVTVNKAGTYFASCSNDKVCLQLMIGHYNIYNWKRQKFCSIDQQFY